jgi:hypothetical protein
MHQQGTGAHHGYSAGVPLPGLETPMFQPHLAAALAQAHVRDLHQQAADAAQAHLTRPAPSAVQRLLTALHLRPAGPLLQTR